MKVGNKVGFIFFLGVILEVTYRFIDQRYKLVYSFICIFILAPILLVYLKNVMNEYTRQEKINQAKAKKNSKGNTNNQNANTNKQVTKFIPKVIENESYELLRNCFHDMIQGKQLSNSQILTFLDVINSNLGNHLGNYRNFKFENQAHEIYTKLKSSKFKDNDYRVLYNELIRISDGLEEIDADHYKEAISNSNN